MYNSWPDINEAAVSQRIRSASSGEWETESHRNAAQWQYPDTMPLDITELAEALLKEWHPQATSG